MRHGLNTSSATFILKGLLSGISTLFLFAASPLTAHTSTLWAAAGQNVQGGGTMIAQNYDGKPANIELRMVVPMHGFTYTGLFPAKGQKKSGPMAGINEKGLTVVTAAAETLPPLKGRPPAEYIMEKLLTGFDTVDAVITDQTVFMEKTPVFYMIADKTKIALIEIAPGGKCAVNVADNGYLHHTNHYVTDMFLSLNKKINTSSETRFDRMGYLLKNYTQPFTMESFITLGQDKAAGADNSIFRAGSPHDKKRTLANWIVLMPMEGPPELHVSLFGPDDTVKEFDIRLDHSFWTEGLE